MLDHFSKQSWVSLRDELLDHSPRQYFGKSSLKFLSQPFSFFFLSCHALTPNFLGFPSAYEMHYAISKPHMSIYQLCIYINKIYILITCYLIHINNIKIGTLELINNSTSNGPHTIIFYIIQTSMLTHQLACINISFSNTHFKPFNSTITVLLSFTHHSCSSCQVTTHKQFHMDNFRSNQANRDCF